MSSSAKVYCLFAFIGLLFLGAIGYILILT